MNTPTWETMERGDYVLCVYDSTYHYVARVFFTHENERFARRAWGENQDGHTWKYMYFLTEPIERIESLRSVLRFRLLLGGGSADRLKVVSVGRK